MKDGKDCPAVKNDLAGPAVDSPSEDEELCQSGASA